MGDRRRVHVPHVICNLTVAADKARFMQTGPKAGSFDGGYGTSYPARMVGQKKATKVWFLCGPYNAQRVLDTGLANTVISLDRLDEETVQCYRKMLDKSQMAISMLKSGMNADCGGQDGLRELAGNATLLLHQVKGRRGDHNAYNERRKPNFSRFPYGRNRDGTHARRSHYLPW